MAKWNRVQPPETIVEAMPPCNNCHRCVVCYTYKVTLSKQEDTKTVARQIALSNGALTLLIYCKYFVCFPSLLTTN